MAILTLAFVGTACDDPMALIRPEPPARLNVRLVLDPDTSDYDGHHGHDNETPEVDQALFVGWPRNLDESEVDADASVVSGEILQEERVVAPALLADDVGTVDEEGHCPVHIEAPYMFMPGGCYVLYFAPQHGATYRLRVRHPDLPSVEAVTTVPGAFEILSVVARGDPPGTEELEVHWSPSHDVYRYVVALHGSDYPRTECAECERPEYGWSEATEDTFISTRVPAELNEGGQPPWHVHVFALDRALYEHTTTGTSEGLFPVPPKNNVDGGYGVVGSWVRRLHVLEEE